MRPAPGPADAAQPPRFAMLEVVREFGLEQLAASGEEPAARQRHAAFYLALAEQAWPELIRWQNVHQWFDLFAAEHDNLRVALSWSLEHDPPVAVALAGALLWFWQDCGHRGEGRRWLRRALERAPETATMERARAMFASGLLAHWQDDDNEAIPAFEDAQARWQALGDAWGQRMTPLFLGVIRKDAGTFDEAIPHLEACLARCRADRDDALASYALMHLAITRWGAGATQLAMRQLGEALAIHRRRGDPIATNLALAYLCLIAAEQNAAADATSLLAEGVDLCRSITAQEEIAFCLASGAVLATALNQPLHAARLFGAQSRLREEQGNPAKEPERTAYERSAAQALADLGESTYQAAWEEGRRLTTAAALDVAAAVAQDAAPAPVIDPSVASGLTRREIEVLRLVAAGRTNAQLAEELFITAGTARIHVSNILGKLGASTRTEAAAIARERDLV